MDFKSMLNQLSQLSEATKETPTGKIHKAEPGGYGRKFDTDEEGDEKKEKKPEVKRGRGRPKKGADSDTGEVKTYSGAKDLQSAIVGNLPKGKLPGKASKKHSLKEWVEEVEAKHSRDVNEGIMDTVKGMFGGSKPASGRLTTYTPSEYEFHVPFMDVVDGKPLAGTGPGYSTGAIWDKFNKLARIVEPQGGKIFVYPRPETNQLGNLIIKVKSNLDAKTIKNELAKNNLFPADFAKVILVDPQKNMDYARRAGQTFEQQGVAEGQAPEIDELATNQYAQQIIKALRNQYGPYFDHRYNRDGSIQIWSKSKNINPNSVITPWYKEFRSKGWRFDQPVNGEFTIAVNKQQGVAEAEQVTMEPAKTNTQVIKQGTKTLGTVSNPTLAATIKSAIGKGEMSLAGDQLGEDDTDYSAKKARAGKDIGKPGKQFAKIAKSAGERYGSKERGEKVAGAVLAKLRKSHTSESVNESVLNEAFTVQGLKQVVFQLTNLRKQAKLAELGQGRAPEPTEVVNTLYDAIVAIEDVLIPMMEKQAQVREGEIPHESGVDNMGAALGAGRSQTTLESAKPDFIDLDKDGDKKESMKKAADDAKKDKKKVNESMHKHSAAKLMGKAHALAKEGYNCKYEDMDEAKMYHEGYKEGLDECYGMGGGVRNEPIVGMEEAMPATVPGMASQAMPTMEDDVEEGNAFTAALKATPKGEKFTVGGKTFVDRSNYEESMAFESWDKELNALLTEGEKVDEGMSVSISKGHQGSPDTVSVTAQDAEADQLLGLIKQAGLGLFGSEEASDYGAPQGEVPQHGGVDVVGDHDGMMALIKKVTGGEPGNGDYADEEGEESQEHDHEESCESCGQAPCDCEKEMVDEVESEDQMTYEIAEDNPPDSDEAETAADENAEAAEDEALAKADELNEWANQAGTGPGKGTDASFEQDIEFMTKVISGGLNKPKSTGQTTIPVIAGQDTRMEDPSAWARLAGVRK